ncbi:hypothetical protein [Streptomyces sp. SPB4]|uniref:hypothetical protein n=1 Tax=Streptomyces sp. SPB4 TaxID=2940553 RepID=UPI0024772DBB|nr:hypothetical protein [Streptomyces sp. SPB4]MDH6545536.1 hypothetical protein [Streptomyces sp. SPB4]
MTTQAAAVEVPEPATPLELVPDLPTESIGELGVAVTTALVHAWEEVRKRHPDVPEAIITMATGGRESAVKLAHFWANKWAAREGDARHHEVFVTAEALANGAAKVIGDLIHEAVHGLCATREIDDCSVSQYHNKYFKAAAAELGLVQRGGVSVNERKKYGFAFTSLSEEAKAAYADHIAALDAAIKATRKPDTLAITTTRSRKKGGTDAAGGDAAGEQGKVPPPRAEKEDRNYAKAICACDPPTVIRVSPRTLDKRKILCGDCKAAFTQEGQGS